MTRRARPFTIADAMALIAATAVGLVLFPYAAGAASYQFELQRPQNRVVTTALVVSFGMAPMALAWSFALLGLGLRSPRPPLRRLVRGPGFAGCLACAVTTEVVVLSWVTAWVLRFAIDPLSYGPYGRGLSILPAIGSGVAVSWAILSASGRRRTPETWVGLAGRWASGYFVAMMPVYHIVFDR